MTPDLYLLIYMLIALAITVIFNTEPIGSLLWILYPILIPLEMYQDRKKKERNKNLEFHPHKKLPLYDDFIEQSKKQ